MGGSTDRGEVPFEPFRCAIQELKRLGLRIFMHVGLVNERRARILSEIGPDMVLYDVVLSEPAIKDVLNLDAPRIAFVEGLRLLREYGVRVAPHVVIGINRGRVESEYEALDLIVREDPEALILVVFTPYPGTPLGTIDPPKVKEVLKVLRYARSVYSGPLALGCMRSRG